MGDDSITNFWRDWKRIKMDYSKTTFLTSKQMERYPET
jgi:hypothetical protein